MTFDPTNPTIEGRHEATLEHIETYGATAALTHCFMHNVDLEEHNELVTKTINDIKAKVSDILEECVDDDDGMLLLAYMALLCVWLGNSVIGNLEMFKFQSELDAIDTAQM